MGEEFNIFKNLDDLRKTNFLDQLKSLKPPESTELNDSQDLENDDFDFDHVVKEKVVKKGPAKTNVEKGKMTTCRKTPKRSTKSRRKSNSTDGSLSPTMPLLQNIPLITEELPVRRRSRRSKQTSPLTEQEQFELLYPPPSKYKDTVKRKNKGRGRGRGRSNAILSVSSINNSADYSASPSSIASQLSSNEVTGQETDASAPTNSSTLSIMERFLQQGRSGRSRVMRARRQYIAEIAARSAQVDFIDLVSSPMPRVEGFIDLDLYTEEEEEPRRTTRSKKKVQDQAKLKSKSISNSTIPTLDTFDEDNPELNIKVNWKGKPEAFKLRKHQKFSIIFEQLAKRENIDMENIVFNLNDRIILADDTPDTINYKVFHFIDGRVLSKSFTPLKAAAAGSKKRDANKITLKIQSDKWKRPLQIEMTKTDKFRILYIKCAEELNVAVDKLKLSFDGELLEINDTPSDLDLEGGEAIDLHIKD